MHFTDQTQETILLQAVPERIVSVVPSQTELLYDLGLDKKVVGITSFCVHPAKWAASKPRIGGTKKLDIDKITALAPDLVIANKEENEKDQVGLLKKHFPVWVSNVKTLADAVSMIGEIGKLTAVRERSDKLIRDIQSAFAGLERKGKQLTVLYLVWRNPFMSVGSDTFIHDMLTRCNLKNLCEGKTRYPELSSKEISGYNPDLIFLSSEPFPFSTRHVSEVQALCPGAQIRLVDGQYFSWYGSRLVHAPGYFKELVSKIAFAN